MTVTAVFPLLSATIILYSGILHLLLFLKNQTEKMNFYFVFWCLATTAYSIASAGLYNSHDPDVSQAWQTGQFYSLVLGTPVQILFFGNTWASPIVGPPRSLSEGMPSS